MNPKVDLMLSTIERALEVSILPNATNPSAREEASLALLFTRWIRDVIDDVAAAEGASAADCRGAWADVRKLCEADPAAARLVEGESPDGATPREEAQAIKAALGRVLQGLRASCAASLAEAARARLYALGVREIERERAFGRSTRLDPEWASLKTLAELSRKERT